MLIHSIDVVFEAGHGGAGKISFFHNEKGPDGGDGGKGGDFYIQTVSDLTALNKFSHKTHIKAVDGKSGESNKKSGHRGDDITITLPIGSLLIDQQTGHEIELLTENETILIAKGGMGGMGNASLRSARNTTPMHAQKGLPGEIKNFHIELRFLADIGLIGLPNAGKSSLINSLTNANSKVGAYPFTTLEAVLGTMKTKDKNLIIADIPGLIEGASEGKGLGLKFLKQVEKVRTILHCISIESENPVSDYKIIRSELEKYNPEFLSKKEIILLTKTDLVSQTELSTKLSLLKKNYPEVYPVSVTNPEDISNLKDILLKVD